MEFCIEKEMLKKLDIMVDLHKNKKNCESIKDLSNNEKQK